MSDLSGPAFTLTGEFICLAFLMDPTPPLLISLTLHHLVYNSLQFLSDLWFCECLQAKIQTLKMLFDTFTPLLDAPQRHFFKGCFLILMPRLQRLH